MKTKALISCSVTAQLICTFVFSNAKSKFSHDEAYLIISEKGAMRYSATVRINNIEYAPGLGSSKKQAKLEGGKIIILTMRQFYKSCFKTNPVLRVFVQV